MGKVFPLEFTKQIGVVVVSHFWETAAGDSIQIPCELGLVTLVLNSEIGCSSSFLVSNDRTFTTL